MSSSRAGGTQSSVSVGSPIMATTTVKVDGMTCGACTSAVESGFKGVEGAGAVTVSLVLGRAVVHHDPTVLPAEKIAEIIEDRGFDAEVLSTDGPKVAITASEGCKISVTTIAVEGMTCGACTSSVEAGFKDVDGVKSVSVSLLAGRAVVEHDAAKISPDKVAETIEDRGFDARVLETKEQFLNGDTMAGEASVAEVWTTTVSIDGMTCGACTSAVEGAFKGVNGLVRFNISLLAGRAMISHSPTELTAEKIVEMVEDAGFDAQLISTQPEGVQQIQSSSSVQLKIFGLRNGEEATALENSLREKGGISNAIISLATSRATITYDTALIGLRAIVALIESQGYNTLIADSDDNNAQLESLAKTKEIQEWKTAFITSLSFAIPVLLISMIIPMFLKPLDVFAWQVIPGLYLRDIVSAALTFPVQFGIGKRFYVSAYKSLLHKSPTMDVLVVLGTSAAFFFSCFSVLIAVLIPPHSKPSTIFDTSTMLITFITLGRWLENRAKGQTSKALSQLMSLAPSMATIYEDPLHAEKLAESWTDTLPPVQEKGYSDSNPEEGKATAAEIVIPTELIEVGDIVLVRPGDKIPADGIVTRGESYVDESMVTGEAVPILKKRNSGLIAGTVNGAGRLDFRVTRAGKDTQLSQIVTLVQEAQTSRAPIQRMADLVAGYFVPVIVLLGLITFVGWEILIHILAHPPQIFLEGEKQSGGKFMVCLKLCISVIVFACPCALGLATPTAVMVGTGTASQQGILVKGGAALETATRITHIVFDKTGTLTFGKLNVADVDIKTLWRQSEASRRSWWNMIGLAESGSEHPIGRSILAKAREQLGVGSEDGLPGQIGSFENTVGQGVTAEVEISGESGQSRHRVQVGNAKFLQTQDIRLPEESEGQSTNPKTKSSSGITSIFIAIDGQYAGRLGLSDTLKPSAPAAITALHKMGISTSLVTGDTIDTARAIARLVGIPLDAVRASVSPGQKQEIVSELQAQGEIVAMVGDGINDSPALATANVGIGLVSGSDIAVEAADIVIMRSDDLLNIPTALCLCRKIFNRIKLNLVWACVYNLVGLPVAMGFFLPLDIHMPPLASAVAMIFSSISVTLSSLALRWATKPRWLSMEHLEMEQSKIAVPKVGQRKQGNGIFAAIGKHVWSLFDMKLGRRNRRGEGHRGSYVPLRNVDAPV